MTPRGTGAYAQMFSGLERKSEGAFVPFVVLSDPDPERSAELLVALVRAGADALELGLPFSDPIADGPVIQAASARALAGNTRIEECWDIVAATRRACPEVPMGMLVYANLVFRRGVAAFYRRAADAGVDSVLVADAPIMEAAPLERAAREAGIAPVLIAPPNAGEHSLSMIATRSEGYVYVVARPGVTGADEQLQADSRNLIATLRGLGSAPPMLGFGISEPSHVHEALAMGAAGAISGSAVVRLIPRFANRREEMLEAVREFVSEMKAATKSR